MFAQRSVEILMLWFVIALCCGLKGFVKKYDNVYMTLFTINVTSNCVFQVLVILHTAVYV